VKGNEGIWVRIVVDGETEISGFVPGAESPNDFWNTFKTQCVRVETALELLPNGTRAEHDVLYINRDRIISAKVLPAKP
jgi:hypothetical protein